MKVKEYVERFIKATQNDVPIEWKTRLKFLLANECGLDVSEFDAICKKHLENNFYVVD